MSGRQDAHGRDVCISHGYTVGSRAGNVNAFIQLSKIFIQVSLYIYGSVLCDGDTP